MGEWIEALRIKTGTELLLPPVAVVPMLLGLQLVGILMPSYFGLLWNDFLCIDSACVEDYEMQEGALSCLPAIGIGQVNFYGSENVTNTCVVTFSPLLSSLLTMEVEWVFECWDHCLLAK